MLKLRPGRRVLSVQALQCTFRMISHAHQAFWLDPASHADRRWRHVSACLAQRCWLPTLAAMCQTATCIEDAEISIRLKTSQTCKKLCASRWHGHDCLYSTEAISGCRASLKAVFLALTGIWHCLVRSCMATDGSLHASMPSCTCAHMQLKACIMNDQSHSPVILCIR